MKTKCQKNGKLRAIPALLFICTVATWITTVAQSTPSDNPILRIETGAHTGDIRRIAVDDANRFLVTASIDKTLRVWEPQSGRLLRTIRVPIGPDVKGELYAVAISPDGNTIAVGGFFTQERDNESLYIFNRASGALIRRLQGLPNVVESLAYSPDGRFLAAGTRNGIRLFSTSAYVVTGEDKNYTASIIDAQFDRSGRLVTASYDGLVRVYRIPPAGSLNLVAKQSPVAGEPIWSISISPDGSRIAIGFAELAKIVVVRTSDLTPLFEPDMTGVTKALSSVTWSADGTMLYAGGGARNKDQFNFIRVWSDGGKVHVRDISAAAQTVYYLLPLRDGGVVYSTGEPSFGLIDASNERRLFIASPIASHANSKGSFLVPSDGTGVAFIYDTPRTRAHFLVGDRKLEQGADSLNWFPPDINDQALRVTDWDTTKPKLNGTPLKLVSYEKSFSLALAPDRQSFLLGTNFYVKLFDRNGTERWRKPSHSSAMEVNISKNGRLALAAHGDGTIRWYRMTDGKELLAFFPHADRERWVLWSPSGYYDASPGAEELIGWHVNNGLDQAADFFPVGQFRSTYYRPDVVSRILTTGDEQLALKEANEEAGRKQQQINIASLLPPVVEIISPRDASEVSTTEVTVQFRVRSPSGEPVTGFKVLVDGRPSLSRQLVRDETTNNPAETREIRVTVPERDSEISLIAENRFAASVPATLRVKWRGLIAERPATFIVKPKLYILAVGISRYSNEKFNLKLADKDASDFVRTMVAQKDLLYRDVVVKLLTNEEATKDEILDGLDWIRKETTSNDMAMVFFAGHGVNDQNNYYYFCPYNVDPNRLLRTGVTFSDIRNTVSAIAGKALFFVDTCHSGNSIGLSARRGPLDINMIINELTSAENGVIVFSAATGSESSLEREEWDNGAFTKALVEGINGAAAVGNSGRITYNMLNLYISERVKDLTKGLQHPTMISPKTVPDFPIAVKR